jgi:hypothetical protein
LEDGRTELTVVSAAVQHDPDYMEKPVRHGPDRFLDAESGDEATEQDLEEAVFSADHVSTSGLSWSNSHH